MSLPFLLSILYHVKSHRATTIAIVLSSGSLLDHTHGPLIDSYDHVVRFNMFRVSGFEAHVGSRTSHVALWEKHLDTVPSLQSQGIQVLYTSPGDPVRCTNCTRLWGQFQSSCSKMLGFDMSKNWCTSGLLVGLWALDNPRYKNITTFGFSTSRVARPHHYYDPASLHPPLSSPHKMDLEHRHWDDLAKRNPRLYLI